MKARLVERDGSLELLLCTGVIKLLNAVEAREFLLHYDDSSHYAGDTSWDDEVLSMSCYSGETIAIVSEDGILEIHNPDLYRTILFPKEVVLLTIPEYAEKHGKKTAIIRRFCLAGRIEGAIQKGSRWLIPENAPYPTDERASHTGY